MRYAILRDISNNEIMECVNLAFSDYAIPIHFIGDTFQNFLKASDIDKSLSFCAYSENTMVGFILNSSSFYQGERVVFDAGTGVIPDFRGKGVFSSLYTFAEQELLKCGIRKYYLEVLQENERAKVLYERQGFSVAREFSVMQFMGISEKDSSQHVQSAPLIEFDFSTVKHLTLVNPSYEHSYHIIKKSANFYRVFYTKDERDITAFCIYNTNDGRVIELGYCSLTDLKEVLLHLASDYKTVIAKNIDMSYCSVMEMLLSIGFKQISSQYEMVKEI